MPDGMWVRQACERRFDEVLGADPETLDDLMGSAFGPAPLLHIRGARELHPSFGVSVGVEAVRAQLERFFAAVALERSEEQYTLISGSGASVHRDVRLKLKNGGALCDLELVGLVDLDAQGRINELKLYFDTATFLKASRADGGTYTDVRSNRVLPGPEQDGSKRAAATVARFYDALMQAGAGRASPEAMFANFSPDVEVVFKSNVDVLPYAGHYAGPEGIQGFFARLFSAFSMGTMDFHRLYAEGDAADFALHEPHYFLNADGSRRYLDIYIVQSWRLDEEGRVRRFTSYNDSAWMDEAFKLSEVYEAHYGTPAGQSLKEASKLAASSSSRP